jgi:hypothetical protein
LLTSKDKINTIKKEKYTSNQVKTNPDKSLEEIDKIINSE